MLKDLIYLKILAQPERTFVGYELQQAIAGSGFEFAAVDIFHHYTESNTQEPAFSLTSAKESETFDLQNIGNWSCSGLILFMKLNQGKEHKKILNLMLETANQLAEDLGGAITDEEQQPITTNTLAGWQTKINRFEAGQKSDDLFSKA
jgi:cell division protein ZipA